MSADAELLRRYVEERSEAAFAELVRLHVNLVYFAALRQVGGDAHRAQDVTQTVFTDLARKAGSLTGRATLTGWLHTSTRFAAAMARRAEASREKLLREAETMQATLPDNDANPEWERLRPTIDEAIHDLSDRDREAVLMRFFEGRPFAEIGATLRLTEDAARMRVERALEKLRGTLGRRGITSTSAALGVALANQAAATAPAGVAASVASTAIAQGAAMGAGWAAIFMGMSKLQMGIVAGLALSGAATFALQAKANAGLHREIAQLENHRAELTVLRTENRQLANVAAEVEQLRRDDGELKQLEQSAADLRRANEARAKTVVAAAPVPAPNKRHQLEQKLIEDERRAQVEVDRMNRELQALVADAANQAPGSIETKRREVQMFIGNVRSALGQRAKLMQELIAQEAELNGIPSLLPPNFPRVGGPDFPSTSPQLETLDSAEAGRLRVLQTTRATRIELHSEQGVAPAPRP